MLVVVNVGLREGSGNFELKGERVCVVRVVLWPGSKSLEENKWKEEVLVAMRKKRNDCWELLVGRGQENCKRRRDISERREECVGR